MLFYRFSVYLFLPFLFYSSNLHAVENPSSPNSSSANDDFYLAVGVEYSLSEIEIGTTHASVVAPEFLTPGYPDMEIDYLGDAESNSLHPSLKLGLHFPFAKMISLEGVISSKRRLNISKTDDQQFFQAEKMDSVWSDALDQFSSMFGQDYTYTDVNLSGTLAEVDVISSQFSIVFRPQYHKRLNPVVGLGAHYLMFSDFEITEDTLQSSYTSKSPSGSVQNAVGWFAQLGLEYELSDTWFVGTELKYSYIADVRVEIADLYMPIAKSQGSLDPLASQQSLSVFLTSIDTRLNMRTTAFSVWAGFNF